MQHLHNAKENFRQVLTSYKFNEKGNLEIVNEYVKADNFINIEGNKISFTIQDGVISENGVNGIQASDLIGYSLELIKSVNNAFSCRENSITITKLEEALNAQNNRVIDRIKRNVESQYKS